MAKLSGREREKAFAPRITTDDLGGNVVWRWHLPDGKTPAHGVVANRPIEECKAEYVKFLASYHGLTIEPGDVEVILPKAQAVNGHPAVKESSEKPVGAKAPEKPVVYRPNPKANVKNKPATAKPEEPKPAPEPIDLPPITLKPIEPEPLALAVPLPVIEVLGVPSKEPAKGEPPATAKRSVPFYKGERRNPYYVEILAAASVCFGDSDPKLDELENEANRMNEMDTITELVPKSNDWNRAGVVAEEIVTEYAAGLKYTTLSKESRESLWGIVHGRINAILTEERANRRRA